MVLIMSLLQHRIIPSDYEEQQYMVTENVIPIIRYTSPPLSYSQGPYRMRPTRPFSWSRTSIIYNPRDLAYLWGRTVLFAGNCVARGIADNIRWRFDAQSPANQNPRGHYIWRYNLTNTQIDHVFMHAFNQSRNLLRSIAAVNYTDVVITSGLWEMFTLYNTETIYTALQKYFQTLRDVLPRARFIVVNIYHLAPGHVIASLKHVCTSPRRQQVFREMIECAAARVFNDTEGDVTLFQYYDPYELTVDENFLAPYRSADGIHYARRSPVLSEMSRTVMRGIGNQKRHVLDNPTCTYEESSNRFLERRNNNKGNEMPCHIACGCVESLEDGKVVQEHSYCRIFRSQYVNRSLSRRTCYAKDVPEEVILQEYLSARRECANSSQHSSLPDYCFDNNYNNAEAGLINTKVGFQHEKKKDMKRSSYK
eukprot:PhF_6_TR25361/c0_g1_i2/m.35080